MDVLKCVLVDFGEAYVEAALVKRQLLRSANRLDLKV